MQRLLFLLVTILAAGCASAPPPAPRPPSRAEVALRAGRQAFEGMEIRRAIRLLHEAVHLDRHDLEGRDLLARACWLVGCGPPPPPCSEVALTGHDPWSACGGDLQAHAELSQDLARTTRREAEGYRYCAALSLEAEVADE